MLTVKSFLPSALFKQFVAVMIFGTAAFFFIGCSTTNSLYKERIPKSGMTNNGVVEFTDPSLETSHSTLTTISKYTFALSAAGGAGYLGYTLQHNSNVASGTVSSEEGIGIVSGLTGYILGYYIFKWMAPSEGTQVVVAGQEAKWLEYLDEQIKTNSKYVTQYSKHEDTAKSIILVQNTSEATYTVMNYNDAFIYKNAFPISSSVTNVFQRSLPSVNGADLSKIIELYSDEPVSELMKKQYFNNANNFYAYIEAYRRYPSLKEDAERKCAESAKSLEHYKSYLAVFPDGANFSSMSEMKDVAQKEYDDKQAATLNQYLESEKRKKEEAERIKVQDEKDKIQEQKDMERRIKNYTSAERARLESDITVLRTKFEIKNAELEEYQKQAERNRESANNLRGFNNPMREVYRKRSEELNMSVLRAGYQRFELNKELEELYKKAPWMR